jgi:1-acyl-sn-glycerol-3-phosphate acyltransferase
VSEAPLSLPHRALRATRVVVHVLGGIATTTLVFPMVRPTRRHALVQRWSRRLLHLLRVEARLHGAIDVHGGNVLLVANHISWLDIFVLNAVHPVRFVAKSELAKWPIVSQMIRGAGTVFIERERRRDTHRVNHQMARVLAGGDVVAIFPEGTTTYGTDVLPFKSSLLQPIVEADGHVQPVAIRYRTPDGAIALAAAYVGDTSFAASFWSVCGERRITVHLHAQPALPARVGHRRELARAAEASIRTALAGPASATAPDTPDGPAGGHR